jgi:ankyrin repeat protein
VLLEHGAKAGPENDRAQTPLHLVSQGSYLFQDDGLDVVKLLLERGADMHARDEDHATPFTFSVLSWTIARVLLDYDAKAEAENDTDVVPSESQVSNPPPKSKVSLLFTFDERRA